MNLRTAPDPKRWLRLRLRLVGLGFCVVFVVLLGRAVDLQVFKRERLQAMAQGEFMRQVKIAPRRGIIFDRNQQELAVSLDTESVYARPLSITTPRDTGRRLARALKLPAREVSKALASEKGFVWMARRISPDQANQVRKLDLPGVGLVKEPRRFYPYTQLACHLLGFAGLDAKGLEGLELRYDSILKGQTATGLRLRDALGRTVQLTPETFARLPEGHHLILTLDKGVQYQVEKELAKAVSAYRAEGGMAVVLIPHTGEVLAMAVAPSYNPNVFGRYKPARYRNRAITDSFEPGSTMKVFLAAAALARHKVSLEQRFDCENGAWSVGNRVIHDTKPRGKLRLADIVKYSSNIGAAKVGQAVGKQDLYRTLRDFGFGQTSGIDLPGESKGILRPPQDWKPVDAATIAYGHGLAVTALQLASAVAAVANGGLLMRPYLVRAVVGPQAQLVRETQPQVVRRVMGTREARLVTSMLVRVTEEGGTGTKARMDGFVVAGKTGTSQKLSPKGGYSNKDYIASFVGFVPADDPQVVVLVVIDNPRGRHYGGDVAAPAFSRMARVALNSLGVHRLEGSALAAHSPPSQGPAPPPPADLASAAHAAAQALRADQVPDLRGLSLRQVYQLSGRLGLKVRVSGWGRVVSQKPAPGRPLAESGLRLQLAPAHGGA